MWWTPPDTRRDGIRRVFAGTAWDSEFIHGLNPWGG